MAVPRGCGSGSVDLEGMGRTPSLAILVVVLTHCSARCMGRARPSARGKAPSAKNILDQERATERSLDLAVLEPAFTLEG